MTDSKQIDDGCHDLMIAARQRSPIADESLISSALELAEGRLELLLQVYPDESDKIDHPVATRYVLDCVRSARSVSSAAPELLEALKNLAAAAAGGWPVSDEIIAAGYAIAKAEGK